MRFRLFFLLLCYTPFVASAQKTEKVTNLQVRAVATGAQCSLYESSEQRSTVDYQPRRCFGVGFEGERSVGTRAGIIVGLGFKQRGAKATVRGDGLSPTELEFRSTYLDGSLLGRFRLLGGAGATLHVIGGLSLGLNGLDEIRETRTGQKLSYLGLSDWSTEGLVAFEARSRGRKPVGLRLSLTRSLSDATSGFGVRHKTVGISLILPIYSR